MKLILLNKRYYEFPENWNELTRERLLNLVETMFLKGYTAEQMLLQLIKVLAALTNHQFLRCKPAELEEYFYLLKPYLAEDIEFTKNLVPQFNFKKTGGADQTFWGPDDECTNLRMKEFTFLEDLYVRWCDSKREDEDLLNDLVAILYRPAPDGYDTARNPDGDRREPFNDNVCAFNAKKYIANWPLNIKLAMAFWYGGCRVRIVQNYPDLFNNEGNTSDAGRYGLLSVMLNVAEGGVFGPFEQVEDQYVNLVMIQLTEMMDKAKRLEREAKENRSR